MGSAGRPPNTEKPMRCYLIQSTQVRVLPAAPDVVPPDGIVLHSIKELDVRRFPLPRLIKLWNGLPGISPVRRFTDRAAGLKRFWAALEKLPLSNSQRNSKQALLIELLRRPEGAGMEELSSCTGWQHHSIRGVLSGVLRKKLGLKVISAKDGNGRVYRIVA